MPYLQHVWRVQQRDKRGRRAGHAARARMRLHHSSGFWNPVTAELTCTTPYGQARVRARMEHASGSPQLTFCQSHADSHQV